jgi:hypothetical protein
MSTQDDSPTVERRSPAKALGRHAITGRGDSPTVERRSPAKALRRQIK